MSTKPNDAPDAEISVDFLVAQVGRLHHKRAHVLLEELGLYHGQPRLLYVLWREEGLTQSQLATRVNVRPATMTKMLQRMAEAGFVERRRDSRDQRVVRVYLSEEGHAVREQVRQVWEQMENEVLEGFQPKERDQLHGFLLRIRENLRARESGRKHSETQRSDRASQRKDGE
jgi:DNA-binding MarR family transcriptional regulator